MIEKISNLQKITDEDEPDFNETTENIKSKVKPQEREISNIQAGIKSKTVIDNQNEKNESRATTSDSNTNEKLAEESTKSDQEKISENLDEQKPKTSLKLKKKVEAEELDNPKKKTATKITNEVLGDFEIDFNKLPDDMIVDGQDILQAENFNDKTAENLAAESDTTERASVEFSEIIRYKSVQTESLTDENSTKKSGKLEQSSENHELRTNKSEIKNLCAIIESNSEYSSNSRLEEIQTDVSQNMEEVLEQKEVENFIKSDSTSESESETSELFEFNLDENESENAPDNEMNTLVKSDTLSVPNEKSSIINTSIGSKERF